MYVPDIIFYLECRVCGRRITAATKIGLADKIASHEKACMAKVVKRHDQAVKNREQEVAASLQGDLFGPTK